MRKKFGGTLIPNFFEKTKKKEPNFTNCKQNLLTFLKRVVKVRTKKIGGTLGRSSRHTG